MRTLLLLAVLCLLVGCAKKSAKNTAPTKDEFANAKVKPDPKPAPNPQDAKKDKKDDGPNWLTDPQHSKKGQLPVDAPGKPNYGINPLPTDATNPGGAQPNPQPGPGGMNPAPQPNPMGGGGQPVKPPSGGVLQPVPNPQPAPGTPAKPAKRVEMADMKEVWIFIENASGASGKMPAPATTYAALVQAESKAAPLVKDGTIILTGSTQRDSIWAFEANALINGGLVANQNGVETLTAAQLQQRLKGQ